MTKGNREQERIAWDSEVTGLGLRSRGRARSWIVQTRVNGYTRKRKIADAGEMTRVEARAAARALLGELRVDGLGTVPTVTEFADRYLRDCAGRWKPATIASHTNDFRRYILPGLGASKVDAVTRGMVIAWRDALDTTAGGRNRIMAVLSGMMRHAELCELREPGRNPCKGLRRRKSEFEAQYLSNREFRRLGTALEAHERSCPDEVAALRFIALTGCRKGEALALRWDWLDGPRFALPDSKSGPRAIWMGKAAREIVAERKVQGSSRFVFARLGEAMTERRIDRVWHKVRGAAQLSRLRVHDLRHSFASVAVSNGVSLRTIAGLLGHKDLHAASAYAKFQVAAKQAAAGRVACHMTGLLGTKTPKRTYTARPKPKFDVSEAKAIEGRERRSIAAAYRQSRLSMGEYCAEHGLDADWLRLQLHLARKDRATRIEDKRKRGAA